VTTGETDMANYQIEDVEGIGPIRGEQFRKAGIKDTDKLLAACKTPKKREELSAKTGIPHGIILKLANRVDLYRVDGVGSEYSDLLESAGVDTVVELATRKADNLLQTLTKVNKAKSKTRRNPTLAEVTGWIQKAKKLPRVLEY